MRPLVTFLTVLLVSACGGDDETSGAAGAAGSSGAAGGGQGGQNGRGGAPGASGAGAGGSGAAGMSGSGGGGAIEGLTTRSVAIEVTSTADNAVRPGNAMVAYGEGLNAASGPRPVVLFMPGWGGGGDVGAAVGAQAEAAARAGYVTVTVGLHHVVTAEQPNWVSDLAEGAKAALDAVCADATLPTNCGAVALVGQSYGGTQTHPVARFLRATGYDGAAGRNVVALLSQDAGYTLHYAAPRDAELASYSVAMIENLGDTTFPPGGCAFDNCGASNRVAFHLAEGEASAARLLSYCPVGGEHAVRTTYADWDTWVLDALKTMLHAHRGAATFAGYAPPALAVGPNGIGNLGRCVPLAPPLSRGRNPA